MELTEKPFVPAESATEVLERLRTERYGWLTTVAQSGQPVPSLVWFLLHGDTITVYSPPDADRITNIFSHPSVSLHLESDGLGDGLVILGGHAAVTGEGVDPREDRAYWAKYHVEAEAVGMAESIGTHSARITITPSNLWTTIPT